MNSTLRLDAGWLFGGALTAVHYPEREVVAVPGRACPLRAREAVPPSAGLPAPPAGLMASRWRSGAVRPRAPVAAVPAVDHAPKGSRSAPGCWSARPRPWTPNAQGVDRGLAARGRGGAHGLAGRRARLPL